MNLRHFFVHALVIVVCVLPFTSLHAQDWETGDNFTPKAIFQLLIENGTVYAATTQGLYASIDEGESWPRIGALPSAKIDALTIRGNVMLAASDSNVFRSDDRGETWRSLGPNSTVRISTVALAPNGDILIGTLGAGIFRTSDNGSHWAARSNGISGGAISDISTIMAAHDGTLYAGQLALSGVYYSTDRGANWQLGGGKFLGQQMTLAEAPDGRVFAEGIVSLHVSSDHGRTWTRVDSTNTSKEFDWMGIDSSSRVYCSLELPEIVRSSDLVHWDTLIVPDYPVSSIGMGSNGSYFAVVGTYGGGSSARVIRTTDDGATWAFTAHSLPSALWGGYLLATDIAITPKQTLILSTATVSAALDHLAALDKLNASITMAQLANGNVADILQNVRWQNALYSNVYQIRAIACSAQVRSTSSTFISNYSKGLAGGNDYPSLITALMPCFIETAQALPNQMQALMAAIAEMRNTAPGDLTSLQKAHRDFLLILEGLQL